ncbi:glycosyl hydrolase [Paraphoma chrysanthemicola]|nr:glycosyl hydrolase [Paraphoma chrysanthemicola]
MMAQDLDNQGLTGRNEIERPSNQHHTRPAIHVTDSCWINDPCAPGYDPKTKLYHLFYQCNPFGCDWGNMSWGHVTSCDLVSWTRMPIQPALKPDQPYDIEGVFTGCFVPSATIDETKADHLTVCYSSIRELPFHWSTPPYPRNAAGIAVAISTDGGETWTKSPKNPVLEGEPDGVLVTGFRDPYIAPWPALSDLHGVEENCVYGLVSGGREGSGPTTFLYEIDKSDVCTWRYLGPLVNLPMRFSPSKATGVNFGMNWECTNFMTLSNGSFSRQFLIIGAEGDVERTHLARPVLPAGHPTRTVRQQLWMCGDLVKTSHGIEMKYRYGGILDHGSYYAANSFHDPRTDTRVVHGWIPEEDCTSNYARAKGWNGSLGLPREVFLLSIPNVVKALHTPVIDISTVEAKKNDDGTWNILTLGVRPLKILQSLRESAQALRINHLSIEPERGVKSLTTVRTPTWELTADVQLPEGCETFELECRHQESRCTRFKLVFQLQEETIIVQRYHTGTSDTFNNSPEQGSFTLFTKRDSKCAEDSFERFRLRVLSDGDILEVFANDRFALATMVYHDWKTCNMDIMTSVTGSSRAVCSANFDIWDDLASVIERKS